MKKNNFKWLKKQLKRYPKTRKYRDLLLEQLYDKYNNFLAYRSGCFTSNPPRIVDYNFLVDTHYSVGFVDRYTDCFDDTWDSVISLDSLWKDVKRVIKNNSAILLFGSGLFTVNLIDSNREWFRYNLIWKKNVPTGMSSAKYRPMKYYENISVFYNSQPTYNSILKPRIGEKKECYKYNHYCGDNNHIKLNKVKKKYDPDFVQPSDILEFNVVPNRKGKLHPTQKPVDLLEYLIKTYTNEEMLVLDCCMGSGSTGIAALNTGRKFIGIEKDENYFSIAKNRIENFLAEKEKENKPC